MHTYPFLRRQCLYWSLDFFGKAKGLLSKVQYLFFTISTLFLLIFLDILYTNCIDCITTVLMWVRKSREHRLPNHKSKITVITFSPAVMDPLNKYLLIEYKAMTIINNFSWEPKTLEAKCTVMVGGKLVNLNFMPLHWEYRLYNHSYSTKIDTLSTTTIKCDWITCSSCQTCGLEYPS